MKLVLAASLFLLIALSTSRQALADATLPNTLYQVSCIPELDFFEIRQLDVSGYELPGRIIRRERQFLEETYRLYSPDWHANLDGSLRDPGYGIAPTSFQCRLGDDVAELIVLPEPVREGVSISATLRVSGQLIVDDIPFQICGNGEPITRLTYQGDPRSVILEGGFGGSLPFRSKPNDPFADTSRTFRIGDGGIQPVEDYALHWWKPRPGPLRVNDIDYDYFALLLGGDKPDLSTCRYDGPGSPSARKR